MWSAPRAIRCDDSSCMYCIDPISIYLVCLILNDCLYNASHISVVVLS